jgi:PAS domain S-box-containing protein
VNCFPNGEQAEFAKLEYADSAGAAPQRTSEQPRIETLPMMGLHMTPAHLASIFDTANDAIVTMNSHYQVVLFNRVAEQVFGHTAVEVLGRPVEILFPTRFQSIYARRLAAFAAAPASSGQSGARWYLYGRRKDGTDVPLDTSISLVQLEGEKTFTMILRDSTERHQVEAELQQAYEVLDQRVRERTAALERSEQEYRSLADNALVGIFRTTLSGEFRYVNEALANILGYETAEELTRQKILTIYRRPDTHAAMISQLRQQGRIMNYESEVITKSGATGILLTSMTLEEDSISGMVIDITERKKIEARVHQLNATLEQRVMARTAELQAALTKTQALYSIANAVTEFDDVREALQHMVGLIARMLPANRVSLIAFDQLAQQVLHVVRGGAGAEHIQAEVSFDELMDGLTGWSVRTGQAALSPKGQLDPRESPLVQQRRLSTNCGSIAVVPLRYIDEILGTLTVINLPEERDFTSADAELLAAVAGQAAITLIRANLYHYLEQANQSLTEQTIALARTNAELQAEVGERTQLANQLQQHADRSFALAELSRELVELNLEYQPLFDTIARRISNILGDACIVSVLSLDQQWLEIVAMEHIEPHMNALMRALLPTAPARTDVGLAGHVTQTGQALFLPQIELAHMRGQTRAEYLPYIEQIGMASLLIVPLRAHGQILGTIGVSRDRPGHPYSVADLAFLQDLADRAGLAIENIRLFIATRHARAEAERADRAKSEFLANMSHELRTPLNAVLGRSEILQEQIHGTLTQRQLDAVRSIEESGRHLLALINDILDLSKIEAGKLDLQVGPISVDQFCRATMRMVAQSALTKQITLSSTIDGAVEVIHADERRLKQILVNLLSNAVKFTPEGGKVRLEVYGDPIKQTVTFCVSDTGIGIAKADLARLFQPFVQIDSGLSRLYTGTGLGLALAQRLAQVQQGQITVESTPDVGSQFRLVLPWHVATADADPMLMQVADTPDALTFSGRLVFVIEDLHEAAEQIMRYLKELGFRVEVTPSGLGASERAAFLRPDVIVLDLLLPDLSGWDVLRQLKADPLTQNIPVAIVSVVDEPAQAHALGAAACLVKPIDRASLLGALQSMLLPQDASPSLVLPLPLPAAPRPRILLAEDNQTNIDVIQDYLTAKDYQVVVAYNGREAIARAREEHPAVILMDIQMPDMDGLEAIRRIRADKHLQAIPIIALTALAMPGDRERCLEAGAHEYMTKPVHLRSLLATIESYIQQRG